MTAPTDRGAAAPERLARPRLSITRDFAAPVERVWRAWARPEEMLRWLGPSEWPATEVRADLRVGGAWRACLTAHDGRDVLWQSGHYLEVDPPNLLRFTFRWEGTNHEDGPGVETVVTVRFDRLDGGRTRLTLTQDGLVSERSAGGHSRGWSSTLDRLDGYLRSGGDHPCG
ncbi:SRPBCC family protein [Methylobacterium durans]|uniref:ATPase n=1 Tax=Methylobacterium durans TaxID=2202825 RepID=A0A2U8WE78_9HYPH|nr:SRPBCC domain-containing protein [Methylobacterium durans]AWN43616.1 ATPase [Methylobacterium durans]